ncbi:MAG TPA: response regulator, partial [Mycobacteriales bacterium]|nr:response regulator [Mycobacteriales bacterium]
DGVLQQLAQWLVRHFRDGELVARLGGEEFVVVGSGMGRDTAVARLAEVLSGFRRAGVRVGEDSVAQVGVSAGVAEFPADGEDFSDLYRSADRALGRAKEAGRGRVLAAGAGDTRPSAAVDVAIVEDDPVIAELLRHTLETAGYTCVVLPDGQDALDAFLGPARSIDARAVLLDLDLPGLGGMEILRQLRLAGILEQLPVIVVSARATEAEALQTPEEGAADHIAKPFSVPLLVRKLQRALGD